MFRRTHAFGTQFLRRRSSWASAAIGGFAALALFSLSARAADTLSETQRTVERSEILELFSWSMIAFDNKDFERFLSAFADDSTFVVVDADPKRNVKYSKAEMIKNFSRRTGPPGSDRHLTSNLSVKLIDAASAKLHGYSAWLKPNTSGPFTVADISSYDITLRKVNGRWLFQEYKLVHAGAGDGTSPLD